ncbi:hypothetical protein GCM10010140_67390 [Streptosporangium pseudovulgare]|uniref:Uncharacterized protein n=1 Tax=Streptosporangium pseudovulgare TaxID=35765 RepID=A0ABQ2RI12_9ACTN|nr:hypothetical protein GCM10010140_67390 [Streptosporangium pseudovulgare]
MTNDGVTPAPGEPGMGLRSLRSRLAAVGGELATDPAAFRTELRVPPLLEPETDGDGTRRFTLTMRRGRSEILAGKPVGTRGFNIVEPGTENQVPRRIAAHHM